MIFICGSFIITTTHCTHSHRLLTVQHIPMWASEWVMLHSTHNSFVSSGKHVKIVSVRKYLCPPSRHMKRSTDLRFSILVLQMSPLPHTLQSLLSPITPPTPTPSPRAPPEPHRSLSTEQTTPFPSPPYPMQPYSFEPCRRCA